MLAIKLPPESVTTLILTDDRGFEKPPISVTAKWEGRTFCIKTREKKFPEFTATFTNVDKSSFSLRSEIEGNYELTYEEFSVQGSILMCPSEEGCFILNPTSPFADSRIWKLKA